MDKGQHSCSHMNKVQDSGLYNVTLHFYREWVTSHQAVTHHSITEHFSQTCLLKLFFRTCNVQQKLLCTAKSSTFSWQTFTVSQRTQHWCLHTHLKMSKLKVIVIVHISKGKDLHNISNVINYPIWSFRCRLFALQACLKACVIQCENQGCLLFRREYSSAFNEKTWLHSSVWQKNQSNSLMWDFT